MIRISTDNLASWSAHAAHALPVFVLPIFLANQISSQDLTLWLMLITLQGMQLIISASASQTAVRTFSYALGGITDLKTKQKIHSPKNRQPNHKMLYQLWKANSLAFMIIAALTFGLLTVLGLLATSSSLHQPREHQAIASIVIFAAGGALRSYGSVHIAYLSSIDRIAQMRWIESACWISAFIAAGVASFMIESVIGITIAYQIPLWINFVTNLILCKRARKTLLYGIDKNESNLNLILDLWPSIWRTGLGTLLFTLSTQGSALMIARSLTPAQTTALLFALSISRPLGQFTQVPFFTKLPRLAKLYANGDLDEQRNISTSAMKLTYKLYAIATLAIVAVIPFYGFLSENAIDVPITLWLLVALAGYLERIGAMHIQLCASSNRIIIHRANGITAIAIIAALSFILQTSNIRIYALPIATIISLSAFYIPIALYYSYREFELKFPQYESRTSIPPLLVILLVALLATLFRY